MAEQNGGAQGSNRGIKIKLNPEVFHNKDGATKAISYVGRVSLINKFKNVLNRNRQGRGCYLVTGYRGAGKTSLVHIVLDRHKKDMASSSPPPIRKKH